MDPDFWVARWKEGRIGFHEGRTNSLLESHVDRLGESARVFVPLCGKTEDMAFLASRGHEVVGIDIVEDAVRAFFAEHALVATESRRPLEVPDGGRRAFTRLDAASITLFAGDFFALTSEDLEGASAFYDRAALVALPPETRARYVAHLRAILPVGARGLVVTFEYDQARAEGPPFAVGEDEVRDLYNGARVELLERRTAESPKFKDSGIALHESVLAVTL